MKIQKLRLTVDVDYAPHRTRIEDVGGALRAMVDDAMPGVVERLGAQVVRWVRMVDTRGEREAWCLKDFDGHTHPLPEADSELEALQLAVAMGIAGQVVEWTPPLPARPSYHWIVVGRLPDGENQTMVLTAPSEHEALLQFAAWLVDDSGLEDVKPEDLEWCCEVICELAQPPISVNEYPL